MIKVSDLLPKCCSLFSVDKFIYISKSLYLNLFTNLTTKIPYFLLDSTLTNLTGVNADFAAGGFSATL